MMKERRQYDRYAPSAVVRAVNELTGESFGVVANISQGGFLLMGGGLFVANGVYQLRLSSDDDGAPPLSIRLGASCLWRCDGQTSGSYWGGFTIIDISDADEAALLEFVGALTVQA